MVFIPRKRMIDPNIWHSEDFSKLSVLAKIVFIGMFSNADDEGRGRAKTAYLKSVIFPYEENMDLQDIDNAVFEIKTNLSVTFYENQNNKYYQLDNWKKWQRVDKATPSKIPPPDDCVSSDQTHMPCAFSQGDLHSCSELSQNAQQLLPELSENVPRMLQDFSPPKEVSKKKAEVEFKESKSEFINLTDAQVKTLVDEYGTSAFNAALHKWRDWKEKSKPKRADDFKGVAKILCEDFKKQEEPVDNSSFDLKRIEQIIIHK